MKKMVKIEVTLWQKGIDDEKMVYLDIDLQEFAKKILGIDYVETEDTTSISLDIEEIEVNELGE